MKIRISVNDTIYRFRESLFVGSPSSTMAFSSVSAETGKGYFEMHSQIVVAKSRAN